jgi:hypothetical protein
MLTLAGLLLGCSTDSDPSAATSDSVPNTSGVTSAGPANGSGGVGGNGTGGSGLAGAGGTGEAGGAPIDALLRVDFDDSPLGKYTETNLEADWGAIPWNNGIDAGRAEIVGGDDAHMGRSLRIRYPAGGVGAGPSGAQFKVTIPAPANGPAYEDLYCAYWLKFSDGFAFVKGGKIPGFAGGTANTGGDKPNGSDGFSARMMWRGSGKVVQYLYHPDQPTTYGEDLDWALGGQRIFEPGSWHRVEHRVVMNTPGMSDGMVQAWFDGKLALDHQGVRFRDVSDFAIDIFYFSTFFGGSGASWAPPGDQYVTFDDFIIATTPLH